MIENGEALPQPNEEPKKEPVIAFQLVIHPDDSVSWNNRLPSSVLTGLLMQVIVANSMPNPKVILPPSGVGGFRNLFRGRN